MRHFIHFLHKFVIILLCFFMTSSFAATNNQAPSKTVSCDELAQTITSNGNIIAGLCHQIKADAFASNQNLTNYVKSIKNNPALKARYQDYVNLSLHQQSSTPGLVTLSASSNTSMCQGLCAGADAAMAIPIIGDIIGAILIGVAVSKGCDNCGGFQPV